MYLCILKQLQSKGLDERVASAEQNSTKLQQDVRKALEQVQGGLDESMKKAKDDLSKVSNSKNQIDERDIEINK